MVGINDGVVDRIKIVADYSKQHKALLRHLATDTIDLHHLDED